MSATKTVSVILLLDVKNVGHKYDIIQVSPSFAQHVLFPKQQAVPADAKHLNDLKAKIEEYKKKQHQQKPDLKGLALQIQEQGGLKFKGQATPMGNLFDKITEKEILHQIHQMTQCKVVSQDIGGFETIDKVGSYEFFLKQGKEKFKISVTVEKK